MIHIYMKISICIHTYIHTYIHICIHMLIFRFFSHIDCYKTLSVLPYAVGPLWLSILYIVVCVCRGSQVPLTVKNPPVRAGDVRDTDLIPILRRSPGGGQYWLENPMDRGAWQATVHRGTQRVHMYMLTPNS